MEKEMETKTESSDKNISERPRIIIVTGMSGSGKTQACRFLEDLGYFCVDNLPPILIPKFVELCAHAVNSVSHVVFVVDTRSREFFDTLIQVLEDMDKHDRDYELIFMDASDDTIIRRYKETRRSHPMAPSSRISDGVAKERTRLESVRGKATYIIDTSNLTKADLREKIKRLFGIHEGDEMNISVLSFGFKYGMPLDADIVLDVRFLPNPFYIESMRHKSGAVAEVAAYISEKPVTQEFLKRLDPMIEFLTPQYVREGKSQLVLAVGCTGGMHRSVFIAKHIFELLKRKGYAVNLEHRDLMKNDVWEVQIDRSLDRWKKLSIYRSIDLKRSVEILHLLKWFYPGIKLKRWLFVFALGVLMVSLGMALVFNYEYLGKIEEEIFRLVYIFFGSYNYGLVLATGAVIVIIGAYVMMYSTRSIIRSIIAVIIPDRSTRLIDLIYQQRKLGRGPAVTVIGGGHGLSVLLRGIKSSTSNIAAVVTVADDGGSSGRLREELGIIPPGDLRNCLVALADTEPLMEKLFQYRFEGKTPLAGHSFGNLFIAAMNEVTGDMETALKESSKVLAVKGHVIPASKEYVRLDAVMTDGTVVEGESQIPEAHKKIRRVQLFPRKVEAVPAAIEAIENADAIILGPGSLYTSIMPNLLVDGVAQALKNSKAIKIYICNVMTQQGETDGYSASAHAKAILDHAGKGVIDYVLVNSTPVPQEILDANHAEFVEIDEDKINALGMGIVKEDLISETDAGRHDPDKLCKTVIKMIYELGKK